MEIQNYKAIGKGCLLGKFDILIQEWGAMQIVDCTVFQKDGKRWISMPGREFQSKDGQKKHFNLVKFSPEVFKKLETAALAQLDKYIAAPQTVQQPAPCNSGLPF